MFRLFALVCNFSFAVLIISLLTQLEGKEAEYIVEEDDRYHIGVLNMNPRDIILTMNVNVSAKIYDTTKSTNMCSTRNGSCKLGTFFPITYYVIRTSPKNVRLLHFYYTTILMHLFSMKNSSWFI